ncbi:TolQ Biopolymer transport proteins [Comamonadaceae bacterium]|jgi:biopolymer transport protein ExbB/TolQ
MNSIESFLYEITKFFLTPVLVLLCLMFVYSFFSLGMLIFEAGLRKFRGHGLQPILQHLRKQPHATQEELELLVLRQIEVQRITSRIAPMLGLVATMIPMGPALIAVSTGNAKDMAQNLVVAFSAVIVALVAAAITYVVQMVRKRWLLEELSKALDVRFHGDAAT